MDLLSLVRNSETLSRLWSLQPHLSSASFLLEGHKALEANLVSPSVPPLCP